MVGAQKVRRGLGAGSGPDVSWDPEAASHFCQAKQIQGINLLPWGSVGRDWEFPLQERGRGENPSPRAGLPGPILLFLYSTPPAPPKQTEPTGRSSVLGCYSHRACMGLLLLLALFGSLNELWAFHHLVLKTCNSLPLGSRGWAAEQVIL